MQKDSYYTESAITQKSMSILESVITKASIRTQRDRYDASDYYRESIVT